MNPRHDAARAADPAHLRGVEVRGRPVEERALIVRDADRSTATPANAADSPDGCVRRSPDLARPRHRREAIVGDRMCRFHGRDETETGG